MQYCVRQNQVVPKHHKAHGDNLSALTWTLIMGRKMQAAGCTTSSLPSKTIKEMLDVVVAQEKCPCVVVWTCMSQNDSTAQLL